MLNMRMVPQSPVMRMTVMSGQSIDRAVQLLDEILAFMRIRERVRSGLSR